MPKNFYFYSICYIVYCILFPEWVFGIIFKLTFSLDGRGLYIEGKEKVEAAVRAAKEARVFLAFVILDNPAVKDSILDIKVPVFKHGGKVGFTGILFKPRSEIS